MEFITTHKKKLIAGAIIIALGLFYFLYWKKRDKKEVVDPLDDALGGSLKATPTGESVPKTESELIDEVNADTVFPLKVGKEGVRVEQMQKWLIAEHNAEFSEHGADGIFGTETFGELNKATNRDNVSKDYFIKTKMYNY